MTTTYQGRHATRRSGRATLDWRNRRSEDTCGQHLAGSFVLAIPLPHVPFRGLRLAQDTAMDSVHSVIITRSPAPNFARRWPGIICPAKLVRPGVFSLGFDSWGKRRKGCSVFLPVPKGRP